MPTSEYAPSDGLVPEPPDGYADPTAFRYPLVVLVAIVVVTTPVALFAFGQLLWYGQGVDALSTLFEVRETASSVTVTVRSGIVALAFLGAVTAVTVAHELLHGLVMRRRGYRVSYGFAPRLGAFYAAPFHQFVTRNDNALAAVAPLVVLDALLLPLLFVPVPALAFAAFVALLFNTVGAAGDVYVVARLLRMPAGTLLYDSDVRHSYVFYPETA